MTRCSEVRVHTNGQAPLTQGAPGAVGSALDRIAAFSMGFVGLVFLAPLFLCIAAAIKIEGAGPVLVRQRRLQAGRNAFIEVYGFRTRAEDGCTPSRVGHWLRLSSLEDLPQLFSLLVGEMSLADAAPALCATAR